MGTDGDRRGLASVLLACTYTGYNLKPILDWLINWVFEFACQWIIVFPCVFSLLNTEHRLSYSEVQPLHNKQPCSTLSTVPFYLSSPPPRLFFLFDTFVLLHSLSPFIQVETFKFARCLPHQRKRSSCAFCRINRVLSRSGWKLGG